MITFLICLALLAAIFMTFICSVFIFISDRFVGMDNRTVAYILAVVITLIISAVMWSKVRSREKLIK